MTIAYFGTASTPTDNNSNFDVATTIVPPGSMLDGDLVYVSTLERTYPGPTTNTVAGGQTWNALTSNENNTIIQVLRGFWCRFNGTWGANPQFTPAHTGDFSDFTCDMIVFRPTLGANTWAVDVAESAATYTAPGAPNDVTIAGQTAIASSGVNIATFTANGNPTFALQTGGWSNPGSVTQVRNSGNGDISLSLAYRIFTSSGASGSVTNRQNSSHAGFGSMITFKEVFAPTNSPPPPASFPQVLLQM